MLHRGAASSTLQRSCSTGYFRQHSKLKADCRLFDKRWRVSAASKQSDRGLSEHEREVLRKAVLATAVCCAFASNVGAARADSQNWVPRRHHRHIGERFTDTWADSIVEIEQATSSRVRELERQLEQERKRADSEAGKRREAEQKFKLLSLQQKSVRPADDDAWLSVRVAGADLTGPLSFLLLFGGIYAAWSSSTAAKARQQQGRWVYDRGLGGKKVWVPYKTGAAGSSDLPQQLSDAAFEDLASTAAGLAAQQRKKEQPYQPPEWWQAPMSFAADDATRAAAQQQASALLSRIEQAKNRGEDYRLADIALLRRTCQAGGGVTVDARTVGGRDAIYKAAVDAAVRRCLEPSSVDEADLADSAPLQFVAGVAQDLQIADERAVSMACNWVAGHCRARIVEAYTAAKKGDDVLCATALAQLSSLLQGMPVLEAGSSQVALIADELKGWADAETLQRLHAMAKQLVEPQQQQLVSSMLGSSS
eukprot:GHRQ01012040.1.p1 GENE.GHRQ01012040.1~~GHRQ01012040.1.p1  ORF type:complete len:479 (+),score=200.79 GHRQ01012040.1:87-1523(+)